MSKISAVIISKNAEEVIADCLDSLHFADEIILIDDGSTDRTVDIAKYKGVKVIEFHSGSFADKRNFGKDKAKYDWIFYVDADERVSGDLKESVLKIIKHEKLEFNAYKIKRKNFYFGMHEWPAVENLERLFKKKSLKEWYGDLHESPRVEGKIGGIEDGFLLHYTHRDLSSMLRKTIEWSAVEADLRLKAHHPKVTWWRFPRVMLTAFYDSYIRQKGYKAGTAGIIESIYQAFSLFITYARLWELQQKQSHNER